MSLSCPRPRACLCGALLALLLAAPAGAAPFLWAPIEEGVLGSVAPHSQAGDLAAALDDAKFAGSPPTGDFPLDSGLDHSLTLGSDTPDAPALGFTPLRATEEIGPLADTGH